MAKKDDAPIITYQNGYVLVKEGRFPIGPMTQCP